MPNDYGNDVNNEPANDVNEDYKGIEPNTVESDEELQQELNGETTYDPNNRDLDTNSTVWGGMESGAIDYESTQDSDWLNTVPNEYKGIASKWADQQGMLKIVPVTQKQKFTYSTVAYIASKQEEPKTQIIPISDVTVVPHQITFDFYDTTEGRIGVSNAVEKHMQVECDVYLTDLLAQFWIFGDDNQYNIGGASMPDVKKQYWESIESNTYLDFEYDLEQTKEFIDFRNTFLQQHSGWVCKFISHVFGVFQGVITDVSYNIGSGESFAKWHIKLEEAVFTSEYQTTGKKPSETSDGSQTESGDASSQENVDTTVE